MKRNEKVCIKCKHGQQGGICWIQYVYKCALNDADITNHIRNKEPLKYNEKDYRKILEEVPDQCDYRLEHTVL